MYCMAVPVRNYTGKIVAAVSASIPVFRVDDKKKEFVLDELNRTAGQISKELGYRGQIVIGVDEMKKADGIIFYFV